MRLTEPALSERAVLFARADGAPDEPALSERAVLFARADGAPDEPALSERAVLFARAEGAPDRPALSERAVLFARVEGQQPQRTRPRVRQIPRRADRVTRMQVPRVVAALELKPGMKVADVGSGSGLFTRPIASLVAPARSRLHAVDIDPALLKIVERSAAVRKIASIHAYTIRVRLERSEAAGAGRHRVRLRHTASHRTAGGGVADVGKYTSPRGSHRRHRHHRKWPQGTNRCATRSVISWWGG